MEPRRINELCSLEMHRTIAERLRDDPSLLEAPRRRVARWLKTGEAHPEYAAEWQRALALPLEELCDLMTEDSDRGRALRQVSPFAGLLDPRTRWRILREIRRAATP